MNFNNSMSYLSRAREIIPICSQTFSKSPNYYPIGASPLFLQSGQGSHIWDVDNNEYIDYVLGLGPITLGYNYPTVNEAIIRQLEEGVIFSLPHPLEVIVAKKLVEIIPCAEMVRFLKTGSEACQAAIRAARAYTGRNHIAFRGYHGWHEFYTCTTERDKGIPKQYKQFMHQFEYNNIDSLEELFENYDLAAVIMEPMIVEPPTPGFLEGIRELCDSYGTILIFDETVTGFRWSLNGAQEYFNVTPDLATFGKGMANGLPLAAVCGKKSIMKEFENIFVSSTFGGECLSLAAGLATIEVMERKKTIEHCWNMGTELISGLEKIGISNKGFPCRPIIIQEFSLEEKTLFIQELIARNIIIHSGLFINLCYSHTREDIDKTIIACSEAIEIVNTAKAQNKVKDMLKGEIIIPAFKRL